MFGRGLLGVILTSGVIAAIGYMLMPRRRNRLFSFNKMMDRWPLSRRDVMRFGRVLLRQAARMRLAR
jgi:hypothetical protein